MKPWLCLQSTLLAFTVAVVLALPGLAKSEAEFVLQRYVKSNNSGALKVLFIGNSFTYFYDMPAIFAALVDSAKPKADMKIEAAVAGGVTLEELRRRDAQHVIADDGPWDFIVLQEQSRRPIEAREKMLSSCLQFKGEIEKLGAKMVLYETWPDKTKPNEAQMLIDAYENTAKGCAALVAPVGRAWRAVEKEWPSIDLYDRDGHHPSQAGAYLAACVFYAEILGKSPFGLLSHCNINDPCTGLERPLINLDERDAKILQQAAWNCVNQVPSATAVP